MSISASGLARHYGDDWFFLVNLGWSHTENGNVGHGREITQRGFEARRANGNAVHALAHAMFEDGSADDADALISEWLPGYDRTGLLHGHISWHQALVRAGAGRCGARARHLCRARAAEGDDRRRRSIRSPTAPRCCGGLLAYGHAVPKEIWDDAAAHAERSFPKAGIPFADMHMALVAAATGNHATVLRSGSRELEKRLADGKLAPGPVVPAICRGVLAFADGDYKACVRTLEPIAAEVVRIGGSHAQREIVEDTLLVAFMKGGEGAKARAAARPPSAPPALAARRTLERCRTDVRWVQRQAWQARLCRELHR